MIDSIFNLLEEKYVDKKKIIGCVDEIKKRTLNGKDKNSLENLKEALFILKDAHTKIVRKSPNDFILPLSLYFLEDKIYCIQDYKTIKKGMWLTHIDDLPFDTIFNVFTEKLGYDSLSTIKNNFIEDLMFSVNEYELVLKFTDGHLSTEEKIKYIKYLDYISQQTPEMAKNVNMTDIANLYILNDLYKLTITTKHFYDSKGNKLNCEGITPDILVETNIDDMLNHKDNQLAYAISYIQKHDFIETTEKVLSAGLKKQC
jgi:hypothetical protein